MILAQIEITLNEHNLVLLQQCAMRVTGVIGSRDWLDNGKQRPALFESLCPWPGTFNKTGNTNPSQTWSPERNIRLKLTA